MKDLKEILEERVLLLERASKNKQLQEIEMEMCRREPMHFFNNYLYTDKNSNLY